MCLRSLSNVVPRAVSTISLDDIDRIKFDFVECTISISTHVSQRNTRFTIKQLPLYNFISPRPSSPPINQPKFSTARDNRTIRSYLATRFKTHRYPRSHTYANTQLHTWHSIREGETSKRVWLVDAYIKRILSGGSSGCYARVGHFSPLTGENEARERWPTRGWLLRTTNAFDSRSIPSARAERVLGLERRVSIASYRSRADSVRPRDIYLRRREWRGVHAGVTQFVVTNEHNMIMLAALARFDDIPAPSPALLASLYARIRFPPAARCHLFTSVNTSLIGTPECLVGHRDAPSRPILWHEFSSASVKFGGGSFLGLRGRHECFLRPAIHRWILNWVCLIRYCRKLLFRIVCFNRRSKLLRWKCWSMLLLVSRNNDNFLLECGKNWYCFDRK